MQELLDHCRHVFIGRLQHLGSNKYLHSVDLAEPSQKLGQQSKVDVLKITCPNMKLMCFMKGQELEGLHSTFLSFQEQTLPGNIYQFEMLS
jgi:hypothetical protein